MKSENTGPHTVVMEQWVDCAPFERLLNMKIVKAENGRAILTMPFLFQYAQGAGLMHGGALAALADTAVVMAIKSILAPGTHFVTITMESNFLQPVKRGTITAKASVEREKENIFSGEATVCDEDGNAVMEFASVFKIAKKVQIHPKKT